jgi:hypothetical protein
MKITQTFRAVLMLLCAIQSGAMLYATIRHQEMGGEITASIAIICILPLMLFAVSVISFLDAAEKKY